MDLRWEQVVRRLQREQESKSSFVFTSEQKQPFSTAGFARMVERAGRKAKLAFKAHSHMLRHACGYALANRGHDTRALQVDTAFSFPKGSAFPSRNGKNNTI
jgi:type 1 fimbriae regulatory protein FimB